MEAITSIVLLSFQKNNRLCLKLPLLVRKLGVGYLPFSDGNTEPKAVNSQGDNAKQEPLNPLQKEVSGFAGKTKAMPVNDGVGYFPVINHADSPGKADSKGTYCDKAS